MKIKKIIAAAMSAAIVTSVSAVSFAATGTCTATYNKTDKTLTVTEISGTFSDQITVVVVPKDATEINSSNIYYIDQDGVANQTALLTDMGLLATIPDGDYEVRVGCTEGDIYVGYFTKSAGTITYKKGDIDNSGEITIDDVLAVLNHFKGNAPLSVGSAEFVAADTDNSGEITIDDVLAVLNHFKGNAPLWS